jgi:hypothetical protein
MLRKATGYAGAIAAGAVLTAALFSAGFTPTSLAAESNLQTPTQSMQINRSNKSDAMPTVANADAPRRITTVEVVGVEDAAIIYRDRDGNILFKTDPISNVTVVTKGVVLPEVTIRELADSTVQVVPLENIRPTLSPTAPGNGCESSVTAHTAGDELARVPSRCITRLENSFSFAALN